MPLIKQGGARADDPKASFHRSFTVGAELSSAEQLGGSARAPPRSPSTPVQPKKAYPSDAADYVVEEEIGQGATATVWRARCPALDEVVAIKKIDLEKCNSSLEDFRKEAQMMSMLSHPNLVKAYSIFSQAQYLWVVMPFCDDGSVLHVMRSCHPDGLDEPIIAVILRDTLKAMDYLHHNGLIHRDIKAGNILLDSGGAVMLADFGVSARMFETGDRVLFRNTLVGTPCWMAPEVLENRKGHDFKADIWSFGITALELAHGHAPFEKMTPMKVLMSTLQGPTPGLDKEHEKKFSKAFKEMVAMCLVKDPAKRPSTDKLLKHPFFKQARPPDFLVKHLLQGLPSLSDRVRMLKAQDEALQAARQVNKSEQEEKSRSEYQLGVSGWNFDLEDLKRQAAMIEDDVETDDSCVVEESALVKSSREWDSRGFSNPRESVQERLAAGSGKPTGVMSQDRHQKQGNAPSATNMSTRNTRKISRSAHKGRFEVSHGDDGDEDEDEDEDDDDEDDVKSNCKGDATHNCGELVRSLSFDS